MQGHGLKDADLPANLLNQNCPKRIKHKSHGQTNAVCWTAVSIVGDLNPNCNKSGRNSNVEFSIGPTSAEQKLAEL